MISRLLPFSPARTGPAYGTSRRLAIVIVTAALLASAALGYQFTASQLTLAIGGILSAGGILILLRWPALGLVLATLVGMIVPIVAPGDINAAMMLVALLTGLWIGDMVVRRRVIELTRSATMLPLLALVVVACIAFLFGRLPWFNFAQNAPLDAQVGGLAVYLLSAAAFVLVANQIRDQRWLEAMVWVFVACGALFIVGRAVPPLAPLVLKIFQRQAIGGVFWTWLPAIAFSQALFNYDLKRPWRVLLLALTAGVLYVTFFQMFDWKSGWVPALAVVGLLAVLRLGKTGLLLVFIAAPGLLLLGQEALATDSYSASTRIEAWIILAEIVKVSPLLGLGFGNYYWFTPLFPIRGWYVSFNSHNNYVDIVAQTGLLGLACFLWFFAAIGRLGWRLRERMPNGFARAYVYGGLAGAAGTLVVAMLGDWVLSFVYNLGLDGFKTGVLAWLFLGGLVALESLYAGER